MNRITKTMVISLLLIIFMTTTKLSAQVSVWDGTHEEWTHGTGTESDPFLIENAQQLAYLAYRVNNGLDAGGGHVSNHNLHYKLMVDVVLNGGFGYGVLFDQDWEDGMNGWNFVNIIGDGTWVINTNQSNNYANMSGYYNGASHQNEDWCISPAFNLNNYTTPVLSFKTAMKYEGNPLEVLFSNDYDGTNPTNANWHTLSCQLSPGNYVWTESGNIDLSTFNGNNCHIGFKYTSSDEAASTWQVDDCLLTAFQWIPIGYWNSNSYYQCFGGHFDGNNHTISGLYINNSADRAGFFAFTEGATIINLNVSGTEVSTSNDYAGGVVGVANNTNILNCSANFTTGVFASSCAGGIVGHSEGTVTITNCYNTGSVSGSSSGGMVGQAGTATITNCYNTGNVSGSNYSGGILGQAGTATIANCYNTGTISGSSSGGIVGQKNNGTVTNSYYLNTCGGNNNYGGQPMSSEAMQTQGFVDLLNNGTCSWEYDGNNTNSGYPILTGIIVVPVTLNATNITQSHATLQGNLEIETTNVYAQGFEYKKSTDSQYQTVNVSGNGYISQTLSGLIPYTEYVYRVFCTLTDCGTYYGEEKTFTTLPINVTTNNATEITQTHATLNGNINVGDASITSQGFEYKKTSDSEYQTVVVSGGGSISTTLSDLTPNTQYRFRAFCTPQDGEPIYGQLLTFNTLTINVTTYSASNVTESSATLNGNIDAGDAEVTDKGFKYWPTNEPQNVSTISVSTTGNISATINNLAQNTYQYRAFAESEGDTYQGGIQEFEISWLNNDTIFVYNADMLHWVAEQCNSGVTFEGKYVKLMNDIELPFNVPNNMISIGSYPNYPFKGTFNGNGKHITNLYIDQPNTPYQGFFGYTLNANLYNVGLVNITASGRNYTGGMVAYAKNTHMRDCYVNGGTLFALSYCGGLVGYQEQGTNSIISGCYNTCEVTGNNYVGGLIGFSNYSTVRNSYVAGRVAAQGEPVGAIIGGANDVLMYYCYFSIDITGQTNAIGENNFKDGGEGLTNEQMRDPEFVATLNQGLVTPVWKADYEIPINNGFPIIVWQEEDITGIEEDNAATDYLSLFPNPAKDFVTIQSDDSSVSLKHVEVYDIIGRNVMSKVLNGQSHGFSIEKLPAGMYNVRIQTDNGCNTNLKLVVR